MSLISIGRVATYKFTDNDGESGEIDFSPVLIEGERAAIAERVAHIDYKFGLAGIEGGTVTDGERQAKALIVVRTKAVRGKAMQFPEAYEASNGVKYRTGDLFPVDDKGVWAEIIDLFPVSVLAGMEEFLNEQEKPRSKEETKTFRKGTRNASTPQVIDDGEAGGTEASQSG